MSLCDCVSRTLDVYLQTGSTAFPDVSDQKVILTDYNFSIQLFWTAQGFYFDQDGLFSRFGSFWKWNNIYSMKVLDHSWKVSRVINDKLLSGKKYKTKRRQNINKKNLVLWSVWSKENSTFSHVFETGEVIRVRKSSTLLFM